MKQWLIKHLPSLFDPNEFLSVAQLWQAWKNQPSMIGMHAPGPPPKPPFVCDCDKSPL